MGLSAEDSKKLRAAQSAIRLQLDVVEKLQAQIQEGQKKVYATLTQDTDLFKGLYQDALDQNKEDITLSGVIPGIKGTVSIRVRFGEILNVKRNARKEETTATE